MTLLTGLTFLTIKLSFFTTHTYTPRIKDDLTQFLIQIHSNLNIPKSVLIFVLSVDLVCKIELNLILRIPKITYNLSQGAGVIWDQYKGSKEVKKLRNEVNDTYPHS